MPTAVGSGVLGVGGAGGVVGALTVGVAAVPLPVAVEVAVPEAVPEPAPNESDSACPASRFCVPAPEALELVTASEAAPLALDFWPSAVAEPVAAVSLLQAAGARHATKNKERHRREESIGQNLRELDALPKGRRQRGAISYQLSAFSFACRFMVEVDRAAIPAAAWAARHHVAHRAQRTTHDWSRSASDKTRGVQLERVEFCHSFGVRTDIA